MKRIILLPFLLSTILLSAQKETASQYVDSIYHINGNILTGELKKMNYGVMEYEMDGMGTIGIEEIMIRSIISKKIFEVKLNNDQVYFGSFDTTNVSVDSTRTLRVVKVITQDSIILLNLSDIVEIYPIKKSFWMRTSGTFSLGANYSKGSDVASLVVSGDVYYRKKKSYFNLTFDDNNNFQADTLNTSKWDVDLAWQRILHNKWSAEASFGLGQNTELGMQLRKGLNLIMIRDISYTSWNRLYAGSGLSFTQETPYGDYGTNDDVSALFQLVWRVYKFTLPKVRVMTDINYLPYFTDPGRYRIILNLSPYVSILSNNLSVGLRFYYNYDNKPPESAPSTYDYGLNLQVAYSFH